MTEEQHLSVIMKTPIKRLPVLFEDKIMGWLNLYEKDENGFYYVDQFLSNEFYELIISHNNEWRFSEISENVDVVTLTRIK